MRLDAHLAQMDGFQDVSVDITQNVGHTAALSVLPTIIKNSKLFCVRAGRIFLPEELFAAMGFPMFSPQADPVPLIEAFFSLHGDFVWQTELNHCSPESSVPEVVLDALAVVRPPTQLGVQQRELVA